MYECFIALFLSPCGRSQHPLCDKGLRDYETELVHAKTLSSTERLCELSMQINYLAPCQNSFDCPLWVFFYIYYSLYTTFFLLFFSQIYWSLGLVLLTCIVSDAAFCEQEAVAVETGEHQSFKCFSEASERDCSCRMKRVC